MRKVKAGCRSPSCLPRAVTGERKAQLGSWECLAPEPHGFHSLNEDGDKSPLSISAPPRATLDPLVPLVLLEKMAPKVLEETQVPLAELVTPDFKALQDLLARKENLETTVPL